MVTMITLHLLTDETFAQGIRLLKVNTELSAKGERFYLPQYFLLNQRPVSKDTVSPAGRRARIATTLPPAPSAHPLRPKATWFMKLPMTDRYCCSLTPTVMCSK